MDEKSLKPRIRFKGFTDAWEQRKFGDVLDTVTDYVAAGSFADLAENVEYRSNPDYAQLVRTMDLKANFQNKDFIYVDKKAFDFLWRVNLDKECIIMPNIRNCGEIYYVNPEKLPYKHNVLGPNAIFVRRSENNNKFLGYSFENDVFQKRLKLIVSPNGQTKFNKTELKGIYISITKGEEQNKLGDLFDSLNQLITLHQRKYDKLVQIKKSLLEKMFPADGEKTPKIRFKGFTDAWEQREFKNITYLSGVKNKDNLPLVSFSITAENGFIPQDIQFENGGTMRDADKSMYYIVEPNSFGYNPARINVGSIGYYEGKMPVIVSSLYEIFKTTPDIDDRFLWHWFKSENLPKLIEKYQEGGVRLYFYYDKLLMCSIMIPQKTEQEKIGKVFDNINHLITLHQRKCEKLKNIKKSLLEKMFV